MTTLAKSARSLADKPLFLNSAYLKADDSLTADQQFTAFGIIRQAYMDYFHTDGPSEWDVAYYDESFHVNDVFLDHITVITLEGDYDWPFYLIDKIAEAFKPLGFGIEAYNGFAVHAFRA